VVAEVKCNIPINAGCRYGAAQQKGLTKDIEGLLKGKKPSKNTDKSIKILGLYDTPEVRAATKHFVGKMSSERKEKMIIDPQQEQLLDKHHVYVVFVKIVNSAIQPTSHLGA
jgi:hypothetical protein